MSNITEPQYSKILSDSNENIIQCANIIQTGGIVVFPTENVYTIGTNIFSPQSIQKLFEIKHRPLSNPLTISVLSWEMAELFCKVNDLERTIIKKITDKFWSGPLTLVVRCNDLVDKQITAGTEFAAFSSPNNPIARKLLQYSMVPIVNTSANPHGKISSTYKDHVTDYFEYHDITILTSGEPCKIGTESTVIKINNNQISIIRPGIITRDHIADILKEFDVDISYEIIDCNIGHYKPTKKCIMFNCLDMPIEYPSEEVRLNSIKTLDNYLERSILVDFGNRNTYLMNKVYGYVDLSETDDINEAIYNFYNVLHQSDKTDAVNILICNSFEDSEIHKVLYDRLVRCTEGRYIVIPLNLIDNIEDRLGELSE